LPESIQKETMKNRRIKAELILLGIAVMLVVGEAHAGAI